MCMQTIANAIKSDDAVAVKELLGSELTLASDTFANDPYEPNISLAVSRLEAGEGDYVDIWEETDASNNTTLFGFTYVEDGKTIFESDMHELSDSERFLIWARDEARYAFDEERMQADMAIA